MISQCFYKGRRDGPGITVKSYLDPELEKGPRSGNNLKFQITSQQLSNQFSSIDEAGAKAGNACFKISFPATNRCASSFTAHLKARKGKN